MMRSVARHMVRAACSAAFAPAVAQRSLLSLRRFTTAGAPLKCRAAVAWKKGEGEGTYSNAGVGAGGAGAGAVTLAAAQ